MRYGSAAIGGLIGGLIGAAVWAAIVYFAHAEVGWIAWGIGFVVGLGTAYGAGGNTDGITGIVAGGVALLSVVIGKYAAVYMLVANAMPAAEIKFDQESMVARQAFAMARERRDAGKPVKMAGNKSWEDAEFEDLPADIRDEAKRKWNAIPPADQEAQIKEAEEEVNEMVAGMAGAVRDQGFKESFGPFDLLWFFLAAATAYRIGSGSSND